MVSPVLVKSLCPPGILEVAGGVLIRLWCVRMSALRFTLVTLNAVAFTALFILSLRFGRRESSSRVRRLWLIVSLVSAALILGALQRLALQATTLDWISDPAGAEILTSWQLVQSLLVAALAVGAFIAMKRLADSMAASERIAGSILDRVAHVEVDRLDLTRREREVLAAIGEGRLSDVELSDELHISDSTVQTHVKSLLKKSGLNRRQDLMAVAYLVETRDRS